MFRNILVRLGIIWLAAMSLALPASAQMTMATPAKHAIIIDADSGDVLFEKNADEPFPPASMTKLMTVYLAFEAIKNGQMHLDDKVTVSDEAWRKWNNKGSTMFLRARDVVTVKQLLQGIIVLSGNDSCVVLSEHMAGSDEVFVQWMNAKAKELGLTHSHFENTNGWPHDNHYMSARDLATLAYHLIKDFPDMYPLFGERSFLYKDFESNKWNRNPLLGSFPGADGLKTGHTEEAGYGLVGSAVRDGRRVILVVAGLPSMAARERESQRLMQYAFRNFDHYPLLRAGETVDHAEVWLGDDATVPMVLGKDLALTLSRLQRAQMKVSIHYTNPIAAPIKKGQQLGELVVDVPNRQPIRRPLLAGADVAKVGGFGKLGAAFEYLLFGSAGSSKAPEHK